MQLRYSFRFQQLGDTFLGAAIGQNAHLFNGVLQLNEVGHFIVSQLASPQTLESLTQSVTHEYEVGDNTARAAVQQVVDYLQQEGVLS